MSHVKTQKRGYLSSIRYCHTTDGPEPEVAEDAAAAEEEEEEEEEEAAAGASFVSESPWFITPTRSDLEVLTEL